MQSYKILYQNDTAENLDKNFSVYLTTKSIKYINGNKKGSIAIEYDPQRLNKLFTQENFYAKLKSYKVEQTIVTDQKFAFLIWNARLLNLNFLNCELSNGDDKDYISDEENKIVKEFLEELVSDQYVSILNATFFDHHNRIILTKNGVIHFEKYNEKIKNIIDIINLGKKALNNERIF